MDRRSLIAGVVAAGIPASLVAREASPEASIPGAAGLMAEVIDFGLANGSISEIASRLGGDRIAQDEMIGMFARMLADVEERVEGFPVAVNIKMLAGEEDRAIAVVDVGSPRQLFVFLYIEIDPSEAKIIGARYSRGTFVS